VGDRYDGDLLRIQPSAGTIAGKPIHVGFGDWALVRAGGALWVTSYGSLSNDGLVNRVDLSTGAVQHFGNHNVEAVGAGSLWTPDVERINPATSTVTATIPVPGGLQVVFWKGSAWALTLQRTLTFLRIDPATNQVTGKPVPVGKPLPAAYNTDPTAIASGPSGLWVLDFARNLLFHLVMRPDRS
jgi:virginiamycin B lyase